MVRYLYFIKILVKDSVKSTVGKSGVKSQLIIFKQEKMSLYIKTQFLIT